MTVIMNALSVLNQSLENLETASIEQEQRALKLKQQDLFNGGTVARDSDRNAGGSTAMLAQKLDLTIARVEQILREG